MSLLIKGMEMPSDCFHCRFSMDGWCYAYGKPNIDALANDGITNFCPLIPVPDHGRLIDADAYRAEIKKRQDACAEWRDDIKDGGGYGTELYYRADSFLGAMCEAKLTLDKMPTIIPASEEGE